MYRHYTAVRSVPRKLRAIEGFSHKGESVKRGSTVYFSVSSQVVYSFKGYNNIYGSRHFSDYSSQDFSIAHFIRQIRLLYGYHSPYENLIYYLSCA